MAASPTERKRFSGAGGRFSAGAAEEVDPMKRVAVILSGCGVMDGAEIHESVLALLALDRQGAEAVCLAPNVEQTKVVDHLHGEEVGPPRNVLVEAARIARGKIRDLAQASPEEFDAVVLPGGYGAALNLSDFALKGPECRVHPDVERFLRGMLERRKPIGALCIAPATLARILEGAGVRARLTIGSDAGAAGAIAKMGQEHVTSAATEVVVDPEHRIVSTPCYMLAGRISEVAEGTETAIRELLRMA
jgi:enhancing lycopene biosynthesis protein 2